MLNINDAHLSCFKLEARSCMIRACLMLRIFTWHFTAITSASDGSSHEIDEKELRVYERRGGKRETGACDIEFRY